MQRKNKNRESLISHSLNKNILPAKEPKEKKKVLMKEKQKSKSKESIRCKSQNTLRIEENMMKKVQCKTHRVENSNLYHTLQYDKNQKMEECYRRVIQEMNLQNQKVNYNQFIIILAKMRKFISKKTNLSEQNILRAWKMISKAESKVSEKHLGFNLLNMSTLFPMSQQLHKPVTKSTKPSKSMIASKPKIKKQSSSIVLPNKKSLKSKKVSKSFLSQKQNIDVNKFYSQRPTVIHDYHSERPQLEVIVKIQEGIIQRLIVYPDTCLSTLAKQFGAKYRLPNSKIVLLRDMIESQLRRRLTQITEESADHYTSDRSGLFNTLNYDDV